MSIRLGINPLTWTNDDLPSLGGDTPLETCLAEGREAGFDGFELGHKFPRDIAIHPGVPRRRDRELARRADP